MTRIAQKESTIPCQKPPLCCTQQPRQSWPPGVQTQAVSERAPRKPKHLTDAADGPQDTYPNPELACWVNVEHLLLLEIRCLGQGLAPCPPTLILVSNSASLSLGLSPITQE